MFHTYVASVCSKCFIRFKQMLHSNVSCCMCFILFGELTHAGSDGGTAWAPKNGPRRAGGWRSWRDGVGCACGTRRAALNLGGYGVLRGRGESSGHVGAAGIKISISARG